MSSSPQQPVIPPCPACGGQRVGAPCYEGSIGRNGNLGIQHVTRLKALVCVACGQTSLTVDNMGALREALQKHPEGFTY